MDHNVNAAVAHYDGEESSNQRACERAAAANGLTAEQAKQCDDGDQGCPTCPFKRAPQPEALQAVGEARQIKPVGPHIEIHVETHEQFTIRFRANERECRNLYKEILRLGLHIHSCGPVIGAPGDEIIRASRSTGDLPRCEDAVACLRRAVSWDA